MGHSDVPDDLIQEFLEQLRVDTGGGTHGLTPADPAAAAAAAPAPAAATYDPDEYPEVGRCGLPPG